MDSCSPQDGEPRRKRRRQSSVSAIRTDAAASPQELGHMRQNLTQGTSSFVGSGSGIYFIRTVRSAFSRKYREESEAIGDELIPGEDDRLQAHTSSSLWNAEEIAYPATDILPDSVNFDQMVGWSQAYFNNWHPPFPFLHAPSVLGMMEKVTTQGTQSLSTAEFIIIRSVLSIALADNRQIHKKLPHIPSYLVYNTIDDAIASVTPIISKPPTIVGLQALVSIQLFLISMLRLNAASRIGGVITRINFHLGLHRCPSRFKQFSSGDIDIRRRLFWSIYSLERYLSQSLGLPLSIRDDDIDVCFPDKELHDEFGAPPRLLLPALLARHGRIKGLILELRHKSVIHRTTDTEEVSYVDAEISKWWNEAQDLLDPHYDSRSYETERGDKSVLMASHKLLLVIQKHESTILLNRPVITSANSALAYDVALQKCIGAAKQIVSKIYQHLHDPNGDTGVSDSRSALFWPGFTWSVWMSGLILLYAASEGHYTVHIAQKESTRCIEILEVLSVRGIFWPETCASALRDLRKALARNYASEMGPGNRQLSRHVERHEPSEALDPLLHGVPDRGLQSRGSDTTQVQATSSRQDFILQQQDLDSLSQVHRPTPPNFSMRPPVSNFDGIPHGSSENGPTPCPPATSSTYSNIGFAINDVMNPTLEHFDGLDDIFRLMDVPYQMNEQLFEPSNVMRCRYIHS